VKRPTENWEHGEDLTVFPDLWDAKNGSARCLVLKPLKELYEALSGFLLFRVTVTKATPEQIKAWPGTKLEEMPAIKRQRYKLLANIYQAKELASVEPSGLSSPFATVQLMEV